MTRMRMTPLLKSSQNGFTKGHIHIIWIKVLFPYLQHLSCLHYQHLLQSYSCWFHSGWCPRQAKNGFYLGVFQHQVDEGYIDIPVCAVTYCSCDVCEREGGGEKWEFFSPSYILYHLTLRKPCCFLFCLGVPHSLASSLWFHCKWAESHFCHPLCSDFEKSLLKKYI